MSKKSKPASPRQPEKPLDPDLETIVGRLKPSSHMELAGIFKRWSRQLEESNKPTIGPVEQEDVNAFIRTIGRWPQKEHKKGLTLHIPVTLTCDQWAVLARVNHFAQFAELEDENAMGAVVSGVLGLMVNLEGLVDNAENQQDVSDLSNDEWVFHCERRKEERLRAQQENASKREVQQ